MSPTGKWVEVQIRTERMDEVAEKGLAAHYRYKESKSGESKFDRWIGEIRDLLEHKVVATSYNKAYLPGGDPWQAVHREYELFLRTRMLKVAASSHDVA